MSGVVPIVYHIKLFQDHLVVRSGDARRIFTIPADVDGLGLIDVEIAVTTVSSSGIVQVQLRNISNGNVDMLSTRIQIDANEFHSADAATLYAINVANAGVSFKDRIAVDIDDDGTNAKGLELVLTFGTLPTAVPTSTQPDFPDAAAEGIAFAFASDTHATPVWERVDVT